MNRNNTLNGRGGFTLVEVMMVMAILAIGIMAVMTMQITATNSNSNAKRVTESTSLMTEEFETLMLTDYDDALLTVGANPTQSEGGYTTAYSVSGGPIPNTKQVDITITMRHNGKTVGVTYYKADTF
jgi:prepilin-type N-terminal cleavage/methylation domain-containing protein